MAYIAKWAKAWRMHHFWDLLFPVVCVHCRDLLRTKEIGLCAHCWANLRYTRFEQMKENPMVRQLQEMAHIERAFALFYFDQHSSLQSLLHAMKYEGRKEIAYFLGKEMGYALQRAHFPQHIIVPIPLHPRKFRQRGYNQSAYIARGIADILGWEVEEALLSRIKNTRTQARTSTRTERIDNLRDAFSVNADKGARYKRKSVLLIDDVITTGITVREASRVLLAYAPLMQLSVGSVAGVVGNVV